MEPLTVDAPPLIVREVAPADAGRRCAICQTEFVDGEFLGPCPSCGSPFHVPCWEENGGCGTYGCPLTPSAVAPQAAAASVWGQEERDCPACGLRIKVAARRCVHCGSTVTPQGDRAAQARTGPGVGAGVLLLLAGIFPPTAPVAFVVGGIWYLTRRRAAKRWPATTRVLTIAALVTAGAVTLVAAVGLAVYFGIRGREA